MRTWFKGDIARIIRSLVVAVAQTDVSDEYFKGYCECAWALSLALGLEDDIGVEKKNLPLRSGGDSQREAD